MLYSEKGSGTVPHPCRVVLDVFMRVGEMSKQSKCSVEVGGVPVRNGEMTGWFLRFLGAVWACPFPQWHLQLADPPKGSPIAYWLPPYSKTGLKVFPVPGLGLAGVFRICWGSKLTPGHLEINRNEVLINADTFGVKMLTEYRGEKWC